MRTSPVMNFTTPRYTQVRAASLGKLARLFMLTVVSVDHCLDYLRQSIMCRADYSMYTLYWATSQQGNKPVLTHHPPKPQKCVNWDKLHAWMQDRSASSDMIQKPSA